MCGDLWLFCTEQSAVIVSMSGLVELALEPLITVRSAEAKTLAHHQLRQAKSVHGPGADLHHPGAGAV